jgi:NAD(P)-dependent dehydrogenase (short-subunit alcohol dehydrogenase family)
MEPYNKHPEKVTADDVAAAHEHNIEGKVVLITGCSPQGYGAYLAKVIAEHKPSLLILAGRSVSKITVTERIIKTQTPDVKTRHLIFDLGDVGAVRKAAEEVNTYPETVDVIITSGVIMMVPYEKTTDGFESQLGVNYLGHFLFLNLLLKKMLVKGGRIVMTTSNAYQLGGIRWHDANFEVRVILRGGLYLIRKTPVL